MKAKVANLTIALSLVFSVLAAVIVPASPAFAAGPWYVSTTGNNSNDGLSWATAFRDIQYAVNAASPGDTIYVAAGNYTENVNIDKPLTLRGAQSGVDARERVGDESVIDAGLDPSNPSAIAVGDPHASIASITIDGFKFIGSRGAVDTRAATVRFINNIVEANASTYSTNEESLLFIGGDAHDVVVQYNDISPTVVQSPGTDAARIDWKGVAPSILVDNNHFHNATKDGFACDDSDPYATITVTNNEIDNNDRNGMFSGSMLFATVTVNGNYIHDNTNWGINLPYDISGNVTACCNRIEDNSGGGLNGIGVTPGPVDGTNNWWGNATGPSGEGSGGGDSVSTNVVYDYWLTSPPSEGVPSAPSPISPDDNATVYGTSVTFDWYWVCGATSYKLIVSTNSDHTVSSDWKFEGEVGNVTQFTDTGYPDNGTTFYWWVWAGNDYGWSPDSEVEANSRLFINGELPPDNPPNQPINVSPTSGATDVSLTPTLTSSAFSDPDVGDTHTASQWQIRTTAGDYSSPVFDSGIDTGNLTSISIPPGYLDYNTTYYWHVRHQDNPWSLYSDETSLTTELPPPPAAPTLVSPDDGSSICGTITYVWNTSAGADKYLLTVSTKANPFDPSGWKFNGEVGNVTQFTDTGYPNDDTLFYWWVWAGNDYGWSPDSEVTANGRSFYNSLTAPSLISPDNGIIVYGTEITYQWNAVPCATRYFLTVSTSSDPMDSSGWKFHGEVGNVTQYTDIDYPDIGTVYYWWVWSGDAVWCSYQDVLANGRSFQNGEILTPPPAPTLISPENGAFVYGTEITFEWNPSERADNYFLVVSTNSNQMVSSGWKFRSEVGNVTQFTDTGYPSNGTLFYWWVWAGNNGGWVSSDGRSFYNGIEAPTLISPDDGALIVGTEVTFEWSASANADKYLLVVSTSSNVMDSAGWKFNGDVGNVTQYTDTGYPNNNTTFYWWVWAGSDYGWSPWPWVNFNSRSFINGEPPPPAPTLISPDDGALVVGTEVTFEWSASANAYKYLLVVSTSSNVTDSDGWKFNGDIGNVTQYTDTGYPNNSATFYWWVWAGNDGGWSPWPQVNANSRHFINGEPPPPAPTLISPDNGARVAGTEVTFEWNVSAGANKYFLTVSTSSSPFDSAGWKFRGDVGNVTQYTDTGYLNNGTIYRWWVWAGNDGGWSPWPGVRDNSRYFINGL